MAQGIPLNEVAVILGHAQLSTTARYAHFAPARLIGTATVAATAWGLSALPGAAHAPDATPPLLEHGDHDDP